MAFARMIMKADDYLHTVCLLFIALGVLVVGWVVIMSPGHHLFTHNLNFQEATVESWKPIRVNSGWPGDGVMIPPLV